MRVPKRNYVGGHVAKYRKAGIFKYAPGELEQIKRDRKIGRHSPALQSELGKRGGKSKSAAKLAACRKNAQAGARALWADLVFCEKARWNNTPYSARKSGKPDQRT